jgi:hypothetical protein
LRREICHATGVSEDTTITRAASLLTDRQRSQLLIRRFSGCTPGRSVSRVPDYVWRRAFTLNIDDVLEAQYELAKHPKQALESINYDGAFLPTPERQCLFLVHLHGFARDPDTPFVFSTSEYARILRGPNPWMHMLGEIITTEPFIIAGTTLNEVDVEYYLRHRTPGTPRRGTGPSLLIEPFPDAATRSDCDRLGLTLVEATFGDFMDWVHELVPSPPTVGDLVVPNALALFADDIDRRDLLSFFNDFEIVAAGDIPLQNTPTPFLYGRTPAWSDLDQHIDIARADTADIAALLNPQQGNTSKPVVILDDPGVGKSTIVRRIAHNQAKTGRPVFSLRTLSGINTGAASRCLKKLKAPVILLVDGLADNAEQVADLLTDPDIAALVSLLAADRTYRRDYLDLAFGSHELSYVTQQGFSEDEYRQLLERYRQFGLVGNHEALQFPQRYARKLKDDSVAIAICRILNDFRPFDAIVDSLWSATDPALRLPYLCVALGYHCQMSGIYYSLVQAVAGPRTPVSELLQGHAPLRLTESVVEAEYLIPLSSPIAERLVFRIARKEPATMRRAFELVAEALAPYVNRRTIIMRSPEARLASRLFNVEAIVRPLLGDEAIAFYSAAQDAWEWNSRYWEQRALLMVELDLDLAVRYARHGVSVERHSFPLTTLGKVLFATMDEDRSARDAAYAEAVSVLNEAIAQERQRRRVSVHPFTTLLAGTSKYLELGGTLTEKVWSIVERNANDAEVLFPRDPGISALLRKLDDVLERA